MEQHQDRFPFSLYASILVMCSRSTGGYILSPYRALPTSSAHCRRNNNCGRAFGYEQYFRSAKAIESARRPQGCELSDLSSSKQYLVPHLSVFAPSSRRTWDGPASSLISFLQTPRQH